MPTTHHDQKLEQALMHAAAEFIARESNRTSLITVTNIKVGHGAKQAVVLISVLPASAETDAVNFLKRKRGEMREFIGQKIALRQAPFMDIELDPGAKNAQNIDALLQSMNE